MQLLVATPDPVCLSYVEALLNEAEVPYIVADRFIGAIEGAIGIFPQRVLVLDDDWVRAAGVLIDAGLQAELATPSDPTIAAAMALMPRGA